MKALLCCLALCLTFVAKAQTTSFTFQGMLQDDGAPANGTFDLRFAIYDVASAGSPLHAVTNPVTVVADGLFTVELDFGASVFNGDPRWLEIGARTNGAIQAHTTLDPRQRIAATPYAVRAETAANVTGAILASNISGIIPDSQLSTNVVLLDGTNLNHSGEVAFGTGTTIFSGGAEVLDQVNEGSVIRYFDYFTVWQSFKVSRSGTLTGIDIQCGSSSPNSLSIEIRSGTGVVGPVISSTLQDIPGPQVIWRPVLREAEIRVEAGRTYTISISSIDELYWNQAASDTYADGVSSLGFDMSFRTYVKPDETLPAFVVKNGRVGVGTTNPVTTLHVEGDLTVNGAIGNNLGLTGPPTAGLLGGTGDRLVLWPGTAFEPPYSHGIDGGTMWASVPSDASFKWFAGTSERMRLDAGGNLSATTFNPQSDRASKENFVAVDGTEVLEKVATMPISRWNYKTDSGTSHIGPMAQDFYAVFGVGTDDKHIATVDADGVALAAIQGLNEKVEKQRKDLQARESELRQLKEEMKELRRTLERLTQAQSTR